MTRKVVRRTSRAEMTMRRTTMMMMTMTMMMR